jgi:hypothetical protein
MNWSPGTVLFTMIADASGRTSTNEPWGRVRGTGQISQVLGLSKTVNLRFPRGFAGKT